MSISTALAQTQTVTHIIGRGETIETIAAKYGVTPQMIIDLNPDAKDFVYVGMELQVPTAQSKVSTTTSTSESTNDRDILNKTITATNANRQDTESYTMEIPGPGWSPFFDIEYGFPEKAPTASSKEHSYSGAYKVTFGGNYYFLEKDKGIFAGAGVGYAWFTNSYSVYQGSSSLKIEMNSHIITIPLQVGYYLSVSDLIGLTPMLGLDLNCPLSAKTKTTKNKTNETTKFKNNLAINFNLGVAISFGGFDIIARYNIPVNKWQKVYTGSDDGYFSVGIGFGF